MTFKNMTWHKVIYDTDNCIYIIYIFDKFSKIWK